MCQERRDRWRNSRFSACRRWTSARSASSGEPALRAKLVTNRFDFLERKEKIEFLSEDGVFEPAKAKEGLLAQTLDGDDLPAKSSCHDLCPWKKLC